MRRIFLGTFALLSACQPTYAEVRTKYAAEYARADTAMRLAWKRVGEAAVPDGECTQSGLTHALRGHDESESSDGNTEVVSHLTMTLRYDKPRWEREVTVVKLGADFIPDSPFDSVSNAARAPDAEPGKRVWKGLVPTIEASRGTTHLLVVRGEGTPHLDVYLFDIAKHELVCGFTVDGQLSAGAEDRDMLVTSKTGTTITTTDAEQRSRLENVPRQLSEELKARFGFGLSVERTPKVQPAQLPSEVVTAKARLADMYTQREKAAPACTSLAAGAVRVEMTTLWWGAGVPTPKELRPFRRTFGENETISRLTNPFNPPSSWIDGANGFLAMKSVVVYEPVAFQPPSPHADGWSPGRLKVRALMFEDGKLTCKREWELVTPHNLKVGISHGEITTNSAREGAAKDLAGQLERTKVPLD